jgi:uncharacterized protein involved in exopolysaccharide biosynthesis
VSASSASEQNVAHLQVSNPLLGQVREFIDDGQPAPLDPVGLLLRAIRGRVLLMGATAFVVALFLAMGAWVAVSPEFQSAGVIRVLPREAKLLYTDVDDSRMKLYDAFVTAEVSLLQSHPVMERAWNLLHDAHHHEGNDSFLMPEDVGDLAGMVSVTNKKGLVTVLALSSDPVTAAGTVNAILDSYESHKDESRSQVNDVRRRELEARRLDLAATLARLDASYLEIGGEHDLTSLGKAHIAKTGQLEVVEDRIAELDNTIAQVKAEGQLGANDIRNVEIQRAILLDRAMTDMAYDRANRLMQLATMREHYQPDHILVREAKLQLVALEEAIAERRDQITTLGNVGALTGGTTQSADQSVDELLSVRQKLLHRRAAIEAEATDLIGKLIQVRRITAEQGRVGELLEETIRALDAVIVESQADLSRPIDVIARGKVPDGPINDKRLPIAFGAAVFGGMGTVAMFVLGALLAPRARYSDDVDARIEKNLAAVVPTGAEAESCRLRAGFKLRNEIDMRCRSAEPPLVIAVSGVSASTRTSRVTVALGQAFAARDLKVLLVDADPKSRLTVSADAGSGPGLANLIAGEKPLPDATSGLPAERGELRLLGSGDLGAKPEQVRSRLANMAKQDLHDLIDGAREEHDVVILELGLLSAGEHSSLGASIADQTVLVTAAGDRKRHVSKAADVLDRVAPDRYLAAFCDAGSLDPMLRDDVAIKPNPTGGSFLKRAFARS